MRVSTLLLRALTAVACSSAVPLSTDSKSVIVPVNNGRKLTGRFLHITDIHPDPFYKVYSETSKDAVCHRGAGPAGYYGAEVTDCDSPKALVNASFHWIKENIADSVDFVIYTGDSARHDNDESIPRSDKQVLDLNRYITSKFVEVFGKDDNLDDPDPTNDLKIPVVPTFGNNDILPHNIFLSGPNMWTASYLDIWRKFIPEEQRHQFHMGGWFYVEVIPNKLAVISLNTLYFFASNSGVDGCAIKSEPGYEHFEWLRIQLNFLRQRGLKAILIGHVPPARTSNKQSWDETCWQKYTLWMHQYRDVVVGSIYGHMNIEHFMLQDYNDLKKSTRRGRMSAMEGESISTLEDEDGEISITSANDYLVDLRDAFAALPTLPKKGGKGRKATKGKGDGKNGDLDNIGGAYGERYSMSHVSSSIVPNYFPSLRIFEYNITGLENIVATSPVRLRDFPSSLSRGSQVPMREESSSVQEPESDEPVDERTRIEALRKQKKGKKKHPKKKPKKYKFKVPEGPSSTAPPGPAYSSQTLTLLGYTEYFANITYINNDFQDDDDDDDDDDIVEGQKKWRHGKHNHNKRPTDDDGKEKTRPEPRNFTFEAEYDTFSDKVYGLKDLTVRSYIDLARRIGKSKRGSSISSDASDEIDIDTDDDEQSEVDTAKDGKRKHKKKKHGRKGKKGSINKTWFTFITRAFVGSMDPDDIKENFGD